MTQQNTSSSHLNSLIKKKTSTMFCGFLSSSRARAMSRWAVVLVIVCLCSKSYSQGCALGDVRITATSSFQSGAGRVEICRDNQWGTVATGGSFDPWSEKNAQVACRDAGFAAGALNSVFLNELTTGDRAPSSTPVHYHGVQCDGSELNLVDCTIDDDTTGFEVTSNNFNHLFDVFVVCRSSTYSDVHPAGTQIGDIRLHSDPMNGQGAVEIFTGQFGWSSICPDGFDDSDAAALCSRLGYASGRSQTYSVTTASVARRYLFDTECSSAGTNVGLSTGVVVAGVCSFELSLSECPSESPLYAGIICSSSSVSEGSVRLFGGSGTSGVLETFYNNKWGMVCDGGPFNTEEATTVCTQLGFDPSRSRMLTSITSLLETESNLKPIWLSSVTCTSGTERFIQCTHGGGPVGYSPCSSSSIVAVSCEPFEPLLSGGEIAGIVIGVPIGLVVIFVFAWFIGLRQCWEKRRQNQCYQSIMSCWTSCKACCKRISPTEVRRRHAVARQARRIAMEEQNRNRPTPQPVQPTPQPASIPSTSAATATAPEQEPEPEDRGFTKVAPPSYSAAVGFESPGALPQNVPPPYTASPGLPYPTAPQTEFAYPPATVTPYPD